MVTDRTHQDAASRRACYLGCLKGTFKVTSGTAEWYRSSCGTDFDNSEIASPGQSSPEI